MAVTYTTTLKNTRLDAVTTAIGASGKLKIIHSDGTTILATLPLSATAAPAASGGVLTFNAITSANASATGAATTAKFTTSADVDVVTGLTVGTSGTNVVLNSTSVSSSQPVAITSATITHG
jgi:hypothetical protein